MARKTTAQTTEAPAKADPKTYNLTEAGKALAPRADSKRGKAWALVLQHAGKPDGQAAVAKVLKESPIGAITGTNLFGWARKHGFVS